MSADISQKIMEFIAQNNIWLKRIISLLLLLLAIFLASKLVQIIYLFLPSYQVQAPLVTVEKNDTNSLSGAVELNNQLAQAHLFGRYIEEVEPEIVEVEDAPETKLRLELLGVWADPVPELSSAVITEKGRSNQLVYFIEDELPGGAILKQVHADKVIIESKGQLETLKFEEMQGESISQDSYEDDNRSAANQARVIKKSPLQNRIKPNNPALSSVERFTEQLGTLPPRQLFDRVQDALKEDPEEFMENIGLVSSTEGGYEVSKLVPPHIAKAYGLEPGDRIISVNGKSVGNPAEDAAILDEVKSNGEATIQIQRGRSITTVSLPIIF